MRKSKPMPKVGRKEGAYLNDHWQNAGKFGFPGTVKISRNKINFARKLTPVLRSHG